MEVSENVFENSENVIPLEGQDDVQVAENADLTATPPDTTGQGVQGTIPQGTPAPDTQAELTPEQMKAEIQRLKAVEQSYSNLRPQYTKATQELSAIRKGAIQPVVDNRTTDPQQVQQPQAPIDIILDRVNAMVAPVREQNEELMMQNKVARIAADNPDFMQLVPQVQEILKANPALWNVNNPIETAYKLAKVETLKAEVGTAAANARQEAYADRDIRIINGDVRTPVSVQSSNTKTPEQEALDNIMEASQRHRGIF